MSEKRIEDLTIAAAPDYYSYLPIDRDIVGTRKLKADYFSIADDSSVIRCLGNTNTTGAAIPSGKYFYKYDSTHAGRRLARAISNIAVNATLTENTNFKYVTIGEELDALNDALTKTLKKDTAKGTSSAAGNLATNLSAATGKIIGAYYNGSTAAIAIPYVRNGMWEIHLVDNGSMSPMANKDFTSIGVDYYYTEI